MRTTTTCLLLAALALGTALSENVITLTSANFDSVVNNEEIILVEFYAPWCGHCKNLAPEYEKAAGILKNNDPPVPLAKVDATEESDLGSRFGVRGYPTLKILRNGEQSDYEGPRDAAGIVAYMQKQAGPASKPLASEEEADAFLGKATDVVVLGLFTSTDSAKYTTFAKTANQLRDKFTFAESTDAALAKRFGVSDGVALVLPTAFKSKLETMVKTTTELPSSVTLKSWINKNCLPLVGVLSEDTAERYEDTKRAVVTLWANIDYKMDPKGSNYVANRLRKVATNYEDLLFTVADARTRMGQSTLGAHGFSASDLYAVTIKGTDGAKFAFDGLTGQTNSFSTDGLSGFLDKFLAGEVEPHIKSEPVPKQATVDGVTTLVGKSFADEITNSGKPALVEFYAPWCGHCKSLAPTWDELGKKMENEEVVIAKMDATANDAPPEYQVQGFPTIYFKPANGKPEQYNGGRDLSDFVDYLKARI